MDEQVGDARRGLDQTTGLPDARRVVEALDLSLTRAAAAGLDIAIVALDIDDMEMLNDRYGRDVGDRVLAAVASSCRTFVVEVEPSGIVGPPPLTIVARVGVQIALLKSSE